ncbi:MAG: Hpt domain-containing protein [Nevskiales bacterium]
MAPQQRAITDLSGLGWVRDELEQNLVRVRQFLETYLDAPEQKLPLQRSIIELHQVRGILAMVRLHGAALLVEEMRLALQGVLSGASQKVEQVFEIVLGCTVQLSDYVDFMRGEDSDTALVFHPLINELRVARSKPVLSECALFVHFLAVEPPHPQLPALPARAASTAQADARRFLAPFQAALLGVIKEQDVQNNLMRLGKVAQQIIGSVSEPAVYEHWWATTAAVEAVLERGVELGLELKRLFGRMGILLKGLADEGEGTPASIERDTLYGLLYFTGRSASAGARVRAVSLAYQLDHLLPTVAALEDIREQLRGPSTALMRTLAAEIRKDIGAVKDNLDLLLRAGDKAPDKLDETVVTIRRVASTLDMLGLDALQRVVSKQAEVVAARRIQHTPDDREWLDAAVALLWVEHTLDELLFRHVHRSATAAVAEPTPELKLGSISPLELREGSESVLREALVNMARVKEIVSALVGQGDVTPLPEGQRLLREVAAGLGIMGLDPAARQFDRLRDYMCQAGFPQLHTDQNLTLRFADSISSAEYYLSALQTRTDTEQRLDALRQYVDALPALPEVAAPPPTVAPAMIAAPADAPAASAPIQVDPEIRDIFLEEVGEISQQLDMLVPRWSHNVEDSAALTDIRRAFHTLKGSGRMVGAAAIGDFGWAVENMLNHCLDGALTADARVMDVVRQAHATLPGLLASFRAGEVPPASLQNIVMQAYQLAGTEAPAGAGRGEDELQHIFRKDAAHHLEQIEKFLQAAGPQLKPLLVPPELVRAFHTLKSSSGVAGANDMSRLAAVMEDLSDATRNTGRPFSPQSMALMKEVGSKLRAALMARTNNSAEPELGALIQRALSQAQSFQSQSQTAASAQELTVIFTDEAADLLDSIHAEVGAWTLAPHDEHHVRMIREALDRLEESARAAHAGAIAVVAMQFKNLVMRWIGAPAAQISSFKEIVDGLYDLLDRIRHGVRSPDNRALLRRLLELESLPESHLDEMAAPGAAAPVPPTAPAPPPPVPPVEELGALPEFEVQDVMAQLRAEAAARAAEPEQIIIPAVEETTQEIRLDAPRAPAAAPPSFTPAMVETELLEIFLEEAVELVDAVDSQLDRWERVPAVLAPAAELLRLLHTLKGSARTAGAGPLSDASHIMEDRITALVNTGRPPGPLALGELRNLADGMHKMVETLHKGPAKPPPAAVAPPVSPRAAPMLPPVTIAAPPPPVFVAPPPPATPVVVAPPPPPTPVAPVFVAPPPPPVAPIIVAPPPAASAPAAVTVTSRPAPQPVIPPPAATAAPALASPWASSLLWQPEAAQTEGITAAETARLPVAALEKMLNEAGEISLYRGRLEQGQTDLENQLREVTVAVARMREQLRQLDLEGEAQVQAARERLQAESGKYGEDFDPLEMDRYTRINELTRALNESASDLASLHGLMEDISSSTDTLLLQQGRISTSLQRGLMDSLLVPFSRQAQRLARIVRQICQETGKLAQLDFIGVESELDRNVLERLIGPLEHLLRNAVFHGIELPAVRTAGGKTEQGQIGVKLWRDGAQLVVEVSDDGRGLDLEAIRRTAIARGMIRAETQLTGDELKMLIFAPGFSTAQQLTQIAGRGVGMDVVLAEIKQLGGSVTVDSVIGRGARFIIRIPVSLAVTQALLVAVGNELYALPMASIDGIDRIARAELPRHLAADGPPVVYGGREYHAQYMGDLLDVSARQDEDERKNLPMLLIRAGERQTALVVDAIQGSREIVVKPVGPQVSAVSGVSGATILADGRVIVILDIAALVLQTQQRRAVVLDGVPDERAPAVVETVEDRRPMVMVVDDSITIRRVTERFLSRHGYRVDTAKDGMDALPRLQTDPPDVLLLDIEMPRIDGFELATYIRGSEVEALRKLPIIMITSRSGEKHRARAAQIGVDRYLIKPYQEDELLSTIENLLKERKQKAAQSS